MPQPLKPERLEPVLYNKRSHCNEKPTHRNEDPTQPKINTFILKKKVRKEKVLLRTGMVREIGRAHV